MKLLVLFAVWAPGDEELDDNTRKWLEYYRAILFNKFIGDDVIVRVNYNSNKNSERYFADFPNLISIERVSQDKNIDSDASAYQSAMLAAQSILGNYDSVLFFHTKGISYNFELLNGFVKSVEANLYNRETIMPLLSGGSARLVAYCGHMGQAGTAISKVNELAKMCGLSSPIVSFAATYSLYYVDAPTLKSVLDMIPRKYLEENLVSIGCNRFFFEGDFPSLLAGFGASPFFVLGSGYESNLNIHISYSAFPLHNSAVVESEYRRWSKNPDLYLQFPTPYFIGSIDEALKANISFGT